MSNNTQHDKTDSVNRIVIDWSALKQLSRMVAWPGNFVSIWVSDHVA
jgi:hypothetical protein